MSRITLEDPVNDLRTIRTRFSDWIHATISVLVPVTRGLLIHYFFLPLPSPFRESDSHPLDQFSIPAHSHGTGEGCWCWELDNGQALARSSRGREEGRESSRCRTIHGMCRGWIFRDRKGERGVILVWFYSAEGWSLSPREKGLSDSTSFVGSLSPSNAAFVRDVIEHRRCSTSPKWMMASNRREILSRNFDLI